MIHLTSMTDMSALKSHDFTLDNPLLSHSKMWKHSPIKNEKSQSSSSADSVNRSSLSSFQSPDDKIQDMSVADEISLSTSHSPVPKIQQVPQSQFSSKDFVSTRSNKHYDKRIGGVKNFQDNYLRLGLWPELSYIKQAFLRNSFKQM